MPINDKKQHWAEQEGTSRQMTLEQSQGARFPYPSMHVLNMYALYYICKYIECKFSFYIRLHLHCMGSVVGGAWETMNV